MIFRPFTVDGRISIARTQRASVSPVSTRDFHQVSCAPPFCVYGADLMIRSGSLCPNCFAKFQLWSAGHCTGGGMSFGSPFGAPASTQRTIVSICAAVSERSFL